ncbi:hypothetical protein AMK59_5082 [Oryctes borbonicus]|uniref:Nonsense-mediated mRNA decay factor SMG8 n=1 Tax=Oryctes borbonicus TaxID=1629725 RepID=A0A0T6B2H2_9SCAR|nr:hypothetical protein AMK59_5082 [Oryctes borbonicus]
MFNKYDFEDPASDFLFVYNDVKCSFAKILLVLFYVSHIVVLNHPSCNFDINYIQYFKALDSLRQKLGSQISEALKEIGKLSSEWVSTGRLCIPRLIFYFEHKPRNIQNLKKLEHNMEDRIYQILKKTRIINNSTSLFAIPLNQEFVYISNDPVQDRLGHAVARLIQNCQPGAAMHIESPFCQQNDIGKSFSSFLQVHILQAREKGFDDVVTSSRQLSLHPAHFELPHLTLWADACKVIYNLIMQTESITHLYTETRFSEQRCEKVFPMAIARYQEGLPSHYSRAVHESRLTAALNLFAAQARGPKSKEYCEKLVKNCKNHWKTGKQLCEYPSLTDNPCTLPKHSAEQEHCSGVRYIAACDCGRIQRPREDPYTIKLANFTFYNQISKECGCSALERIHFPVFEASTKDCKPSVTFEIEESPSDRSASSQSTEQEKRKSVSSTTDHLFGMLTLLSPHDFLPQFSSWSLLCLGPSSLYSHNLGLLESHQPGFINSTNYLLPWDVTVYSKSKPVVPLEQQLDTQKFALRQRKTRTNANRVPQFTVKVFIGIEYECPRGNRFMLAAPDRVLRATPGSIVKDTGHKVAESDMPLYFPCPCRPAKPLTAQLMRIHVVTPKAPVLVTLNPRVQPVVGGPIFISNANGPTALTQSTYWIMRLPFIYSTDKQSYSENHTGRLLQGVFAVNKIES